MAETDDNEEFGPEMRSMRVDHFNEFRDAAVVGFHALKEKLKSLDALIKGSSNDEEFILHDDIPLNKDDLWALRHRTQDKLTALAEALNSTYSEPRFSAFNL